MTDYIIEKIKYKNSNKKIDHATIKMFNNTKRKPFENSQYKLTRSQIIAQMRAGKVFSTFYIPDEHSRKPKIVDELFLFEKDYEPFLKVNQKDKTPKDDLGNVPTE
ncbi:MAG: hypothetical protein ACOCQD_04435 [archaeon]